MTDNKIKKALEVCAYLEACADCPFGDIEGVDKCMHSMMQNALDLINRQQAENKAFGEIMKKQDDEISELRKELLEKQNLEEIFLKERKQFDKKMLKQVKRERTEAIKEFVKQLKKEKYYGSNCMGYGTWVVEFDDIDNLVKEMVGK